MQNKSFQVKRNVLNQAFIKLERLEKYLQALRFQKNPLP